MLGSLSFIRRANWPKSRNGPFGARSMSTEAAAPELTSAQKVRLAFGS